MAADFIFQLASIKSDEPNDIGEEIREENKGRMSYKILAKIPWQNPIVVYHRRSRTVQVDDDNDVGNDGDDCGDCIFDRSQSPCTSSSSASSSSSSI
ncbi:hypothetical protein Tco_0018340 [Tanacetum coccineum]